MQVKFKFFSTKFTGKIKVILKFCFKKDTEKMGIFFSKIRFLHDIILSYMWKHFILNKMKLKSWKTLHFFLDIWMRDDALALWIIISKIILFFGKFGFKGPQGIGSILTNIPVFGPIFWKVLVQPFWTNINIGPKILVHFLQISKYWSKQYWSISEYPKILV